MEKRSISNTDEARSPRETQNSVVLVSPLPPPNRDKIFNELNPVPYKQAYPVSDVEIGKFFLSITIYTFWFLSIIIDSYRYRTS